MCVDLYVPLHNPSALYKALTAEMLVSGYRKHRLRRWLSDSRTENLKKNWRKLERRLLKTGPKMAATVAPRASQ